MVCDFNQENALSIRRALIAKMTDIPTFNVVVIVHQLPLFHMDIKNVFLCSDLFK